MAFSPEVRAINRELLEYRNSNNKDAARALFERLDETRRVALESRVADAGFSPVEDAYLLSRQADFFRARLGENVEAMELLEKGWDILINHRADRLNAPTSIDWCVAAGYTLSEMGLVIRYAHNNHVVTAEQEYSNNDRIDFGRKAVKVLQEIDPALDPDVLPAKARILHLASCDLLDSEEVSDLDMSLRCNEDVLSIYDQMAEAEYLAKPGPADRWNAYLGAAQAAAKASRLIRVGGGEYSALEERAADHLKLAIGCLAQLRETGEDTLADSLVPFTHFYAAYIGAEIDCLGDERFTTHALAAVDLLAGQDLAHMTEMRWKADIWLPAFAEICPDRRDDILAYQQLFGPVN